MINNKIKKIALLTYENFNEEIQNILLDSETEYLIFLYFTSNANKNLNLLEKTKKYFFNPSKDEYMKNVLILSKKEFLANDLLVRGIITPNNLENFDYFNFINLYEQNNDLNIDKFLIDNRDTFNYKLDLYDKKSPWLYYQNKTGILIIDENTHDKILKNYHKVRFFIPEIVLVTLGGTGDEKLIKLLKLIGADAHITLGFINKLAIPYTKRTDAYVYIEKENYAEIGRNFINKILFNQSYPNNLIELRNFLKIPEKNFEADMTYDEEREINKKEIKYYSLVLESGRSLKNEVTINEDTLIFNSGLQKKYTLSKISNSSMS